jgi:hypothetical protein
VPLGSFLRISLLVFVIFIGCQGESGDDGAIFEVTDFGVLAQPPDQGYFVYHGKKDFGEKFE